MIGYNIGYGYKDAYDIVKVNNSKTFILLTKTTAAQSEDALSYDRMRGLHFLAVVFVATVIALPQKEGVPREG